jgi:hypothetical protein
MLAVLRAGSRFAHGREGGWLCRHNLRFYSADTAGNQGHQGGVVAAREPVICPALATSQLALMPVERVIRAHSYASADILAHGWPNSRRPLSAALSIV